MNEPLARPSGEESRIPPRAEPFGAFAYREYRLLWSGLLVGYIGYWMQFTSMTYLVGVTLAHDAVQSSLNLALLGAFRAAPVLPLGPLAGYVADRYSKRTVLIIVNTAQMLLAFALAFVAARSGTFVLILVYLIAALQAAAQTFDNPSRQSWIPSLVPRHMIANAIGFSSTAFNAPMMVGPALAGILIGILGVSASFVINAILCVGTVIALLMMKPSPPANTSREPMLRQIGEGLRFVFSHPLLGWLCLALVATSALIRPQTQLLAGYTVHVLHSNAAGYGGILAAGGVGTLAGALVTALTHTKHRARQWFAGSLVASVSLIALALTNQYYSALFFQATIGAGMMVSVGATQVLIQSHSPEAMRGRSMSVYSMIQTALIPGGALILGSFGSVVGLSTAFGVAGALAVATYLCVWFARPALRRS